jgi:hypothetical protein
MQQISRLLRELPTDLNPTDEIGAITGLSDTQLIEAVGHAISRPKANGGSSYTLHAPMELLARAALLPLVPPNARRVARMRIAGIAALYAAQGDEIEASSHIDQAIPNAKEALIEALREYDSAIADAALVALAPNISANEICDLLTDEIVSRLGAAVHAPILLAALLEASARYGNLLHLLRTSIRALATAETLPTGSNPRLSWVSETIDLSGPGNLWDALADPPRVTSHYFIAPTMLAVEADGLAARRLGRATQNSPDVVAESLFRIAALSMLQDDPDRAPYGWTHCLTIPQGIMALAPYSKDKTLLARIAATAVLGFRSTLGRVPLDKSWRPSGSPDVSALAARAAAHEDAHLAKYTVACLSAAATDRSARDLFVAAADHLGKWWDARASGAHEE